MDEETMDTAHEDATPTVPAIHVAMLVMVAVLVVTAAAGCIVLDPVGMEVHAEDKREVATD